MKYTEAQKQVYIDNGIEDQYEVFRTRTIDVFHREMFHARNILILMLIMIVAVGMASAYSVTSQIIEPLNTITRRIASMEVRNSQFMMENIYKTGDEIEVLAESFAKQSARTMLYIDQIKLATAEKERIGAELDTARRIQASQLPVDFDSFCRQHKVSLHAGMRPAREVGGDFYDYFMADSDHICLVMADVSGSMYGRPMATSVSLAIYFAQRNKGPFANTFMTFSNRPELVTLKGENLFEQVRFVSNADWAMNTDVEAAFDLILKTAVKNRVGRDELPTSIVIISDMEFDRCSNPDWTFYDTMKAKYQSFGYELPNIVFWNVNSIKNTYQASFDRKGVQLASGSSATVFASLTEGKDMAPYDYMCSVLNAKRYAPIIV